MSNEYLALRIQQGDTSAIEQLWRQTEGLALWVMKRYKPTVSVEEGDLLQAAYFAMLKAAQIFDASRGLFSTLYVLHLRSAYCDTLSLGRKRVEEVACLDAPIGEEQDTALRDMIVDENAVDPEENTVLEAINKDLLQAVERLPDRWGAIIRARYFDCLTLTQCAALLKITPARVQRIEQDALGRLRHDEVLLRAVFDVAEDDDSLISAINPF